MKRKDDPISSPSLGLASLFQSSLNEPTITAFLEQEDPFVGDVTNDDSFTNDEDSADSDSSSEESSDSNSGDNSSETEESSENDSESEQTSDNEALESEQTSDNEALESEQTSDNEALESEQTSENEALESEQTSENDSESEQTSDNEALESEQTSDNEALESEQTSDSETKDVVSYVAYRRSSNKEFARRVLKRKQKVKVKDLDETIRKTEAIRKEENQRIQKKKRETQRLRNKVTRVSSKAKRKRRSSTEEANISRTVSCYLMNRSICKSKTIIHNLLSGSSESCRVSWLSFVYWFDRSELYSTLSLYSYSFYFIPSYDSFD